MSASQGSMWESMPRHRNLEEILRAAFASDRREDARLYDPFLRYVELFEAVHMRNAAFDDMVTVRFVDRLQLAESATIESDEKKVTQNYEIAKSALYKSIDSARTSGLEEIIQDMRLQDETLRNGVDEALESQGVKDVLDQLRTRSRLSGGALENLKLMFVSYQKTVGVVFVLLLIFFVLFASYGDDGTDTNFLTYSYDMLSDLGSELVNQYLTGRDSESYEGELYEVREQFKKLRGDMFNTCVQGETHKVKNQAINDIFQKVVMPKFTALVSGSQQPVTNALTGMTSILGVVNTAKATYDASGASYTKCSSDYIEDIVFGASEESIKAMADGFNVVGEERVLFGEAIEMLTMDTVEESVKNVELGIMSQFAFMRSVVVTVARFLLNYAEIRLQEHEYPLTKKALRFTSHALYAAETVATVYVSLDKTIHYEGNKMREEAREMLSDITGLQRMDKKYKALARGAMISRAPSWFSVMKNPATRELAKNILTDYSSGVSIGLTAVQTAVLGSSAWGRKALTEGSTTIRRSSIGNGPDEGRQPAAKQVDCLVLSPDGSGDLVHQVCKIVDDIGKLLGTEAAGSGVGDAVSSDDPCGDLCKIVGDIERLLDAI